MHERDLVGHSELVEKFIGLWEAKQPSTDVDDGAVLEMDETRQVRSHPTRLKPFCGFALLGMGMRTLAYTSGCLRNSMHWHVPRKSMDYTAARPCVTLNCGEYRPILAALADSGSRSQPMHVFLCSARGSFRKNASHWVSFIGYLVLCVCIYSFCLSILCYL